MNCYLLKPQSQEGYFLLLKALVEAGFVLDDPAKKDAAAYAEHYSIARCGVKYVLVRIGAIGTVGGTAYYGYEQEVKDGTATFVTLSELLQIKRTPAQPAPVVLPVFPAPAKYSLVYRNADGEIKAYTISNPIQTDDSQITAYAFGRGVRTFKRDRITSCEKVA